MTSKEGIRVEFGMKMSLNLSSEPFTRTYGITIYFNKGESHEQMISYEAKVVRYYSLEDGCWYFHIDKKEMRINQQVPNMAADDLAHQCWEVFYPLEMKISSNDSPKIISNADDLITRWTSLKKQLDEEYTNEIAQWYLSEFDKNIRNPKLLESLVDQDVFLSFYFAPLYRQYDLFRFVAEEKMFIPMLPKTKAVCYQVEQKVSEYYTSYGSITVRQKGFLCDERSADELAVRRDFSEPVQEDGKIMANGAYFAEYELDKETKAIQSIIGKCNISLPYNEHRSIDISAWHLPEKDMETVIKNSKR